MLFFAPIFRDGFESNSSFFVLVEFKFVEIKFHNILRLFSLSYAMFP